MLSQPITFQPAAKPLVLPADAKWPVQDVLGLFNLPFNELLFKAQQVHRENFDPNEIELATLLSIKTGGCPEDCGYCPQAARYDTGVTAQKMLPLDTVLDAARQAKAHGATRFCMGAAWREPKDRDLEKVEEMVREVKARHTSTLLVFDPDRLWRELIKAAVEDVGPAVPGLLIEVLAAQADPKWRARAGGDWKVATLLVSRLVEAPKCRAAVDLLRVCSWRSPRVAA